MAQHAQQWVARWASLLRRVLPSGLCLTSASSLVHAGSPQGLAAFLLHLAAAQVAMPVSRPLLPQFRCIHGTCAHAVHQQKTTTRHRPPQTATHGQVLQVRPNILELQLQGTGKVNPHYLESYRTALQVGPNRAGVAHPLQQACAPD